MKLTIGSTTIESKNGTLLFSGPIVVFYEIEFSGKFSSVTREGFLPKFAYCMRPGDTLRKVGDEEYVIEY